MSFISECIRLNLPIWERCLDTPFLCKLRNGSLESECMIGYLIDDSLYLREYAKLFAYGITGAKTMEDIWILYSFLSFVNESEGSTRLYYLSQYGLSDQKLQALPQRSANKAYTDTMLQAVKATPTLAVCLAAALPCMLSYAYLFKQIQTAYPQLQSTEYARLINDYADQSYLRLCEEWIAYARKACSDLNESQQREWKELFTACSYHELAFWEMSGVPRKDAILCRL